MLVGHDADDVTFAWVEFLLSGVLLLLLLLPLLLLLLLLLLLIIIIINAFLMPRIP